MLRYTLKRLQRRPVPAMGVLLFAAILSVVLCSLEKSNAAEQQKYKETFDTIPVTVTVTNLSGTSFSELNIDSRFLEPFCPDGALSGYISNLQTVCSHPIAGNYAGSTLTGITSTILTPALWPENGTTITWKDGYDENIFETDAAVCLIPQGMVSTDEEAVELYFSEWKDIDDTREYICCLAVAGTYAGGDGTTVYCPYSICTQVYRELDKFLYVQSIQATLTDNHKLEQFRTESLDWFTQPNSMGKETPWGVLGYAYYPYALDISDELLHRAATTLENSIAINRICALLVLCLSAGAGMLIGFLMVRSRKREIALLRTMGTPTVSVFAGFALEQLVCFGLGIALGGAYNQWQPAQQLWILTGVFFAGLTAALLIFLRKNLITTIKEDD